MSRLDELERDLFGKPKEDKWSEIRRGRALLLARGFSSTPTKYTYTKPAKGRHRGKGWRKPNGS